MSEFLAKRIIPFSVALAIGASACGSGEHSNSTPAQSVTTPARSAHETLYFASNRTGDFDIYKKNLATGVTTDVTDQRPE